MGFGIIIQARVKATRLPSKLLLPFYQEKTVLDLILERCKKFIKDIKIVVATSTNEADAPISECAKKHNVLCFRGDEHNVLLRFVQCAKKHNIDKIIRVCADNPFLSIQYLKTLFYFVKSCLRYKMNYDYVSFTLDQKKPVIKEHIGLFSEYITFKALVSVLYSTNNPLYLEHVTNYVYTHPEKYNIHLIYFNFVNFDLKKIRLTLDTKEDFELLKIIYKKLVNTEYNEKILIKDLLPIIKENGYLADMEKQINLHIK